MSIGLELAGSIHEAVILEANGVHFHGPVHEDKSGAFASFEDPDENPSISRSLTGHVEQGEGQYQQA
jgi:hypothetical protein